MRAVVRRPLDPLLGWIVSFIIIPPVSAVLWLLLLFKAYQGERSSCRSPGDIAEQRTVVLSSPVLGLQA